MPEGRAGNGIKRWETLDTLYTATTYVGRELAVEVEIQQPVFHDGGRGTPRMGCVLRSGNAFIRLPCRDGELIALEQVQRLISGALSEDRKREFAQRYELSCERHRNEHRGRALKKGPGDRKFGASMEDISDHAKEDKSARRRRRRNKDQSARW